MKAFLSQPITWVALVALALTVSLVVTNHITIEQAPATFATIAGPLAVFLGLQAHGQAMAAGASSASTVAPGVLLEAAPPAPTVVINHAPAPAPAMLTPEQIAQLLALLPKPAGATP